MVCVSHSEKTDTIKHLLDVTIAYPGGDPLDLPTIFGGWRPPCDTIFHYRRFNIEEVSSDLGIHFLNLIVMYI